MEEIITRTGTELQNRQTITAEAMQSFIQSVDPAGGKTARAYIINLRQFVAWTKYTGKDINNLKPADIIAYVSFLSGIHPAIILDPDSDAGWAFRTDRAGTRQMITCKDNTRAQYVRTVKAFFAWTDANGIYPDIAKAVKTPKAAKKSDGYKKQHFASDDVQAIESNIIASASEHQTVAAESLKDTAGRMQRADEQGKRLYAMFVLAVNAGLRTIEISRATVKDLAMEKGTPVLYIYGKGRSEADQRKPLAMEVYDAITDYLNARKDGAPKDSPLFVSTGNRSQGKPIAPTTISTMLKDAMKSAGYDSEKYTAHSLRHTAAQNALEVSGNNLYQTQRYMRHSNPSTTEVYLRDTDATRSADADLARRLYQHYHGTEQDTGTTQNLADILAGMTPEQLAQIATIAQAISRK